MIGDSLTSDAVLFSGRGTQPSRTILPTKYAALAGATLRRGLG